MLRETKTDKEANGFQKDKSLSRDLFIITPLIPHTGKEAKINMEDTPGAIFDSMCTDVSVI